MPLLHRKPFVRQKPPADLRPEEEVFLCKITHEVFRTYDEFFERTILCNSLVWSCALTGRAGLTYLEAVESERRARHSLQSFPQALVVPLLHLAALSRRRRLSELCEDVYAFVKDRFFPGETVDVSGRNGARRVCEIVQVLSPSSFSNRAPPPVSQSKPADSDTIVISDSDDERDVFESPTQLNGGKKKPLNPSAYNYKVRLVKDEGSEPFTVKANQISRKKSVLSRERLKLLFKHHCEPQKGSIILKPSTVKQYRLSEQTFSQFFPEDPPLFSPPSNGSPGKAPSINVLEEKLKLLQKREEMAAATHEKARLKREREEVQEAKRKEREDKDKLREEQRLRFEEEKQRKRNERELRKLEKEREREKLKEEKKKYAQRLRLLNQPREDMECENLKELPNPVPVKTRLPAELFGEALMVLEFLRAFGELFDLKDEFPDGITLEVLEEALVGNNPEGPLCELLFFFLTAIFQALDEEQEEVAKDQAEGLWEALDDDSDPTQSALTAVASLAAAWPQLHQGSGLKQLDLDSCTLSEILRLYILASGADCNHNNAKFRYQKQGGFTVMDDPCVNLRLSDPVLVKKLSCTSVYDLTPGEKLKILQALVGKLLTLASSRDLIEDCVDEQKAAKQELREIRAEQHRRKREETALRCDEDSKKDLKMRKSKKKEDDQASDDGSSDGGRVIKTVLERWRESLQSCSSFSQVFVHLSSLERSIRWSRSVLNARCRLCRRKGDADSMLLCDGCDRGHHTHCLRPRLKCVPEGSWFCPDCRPKQRSSRVPSRQRSSVDDNEEDDEEEEDEEEESEEESEEEDEEEQEEEEEEEEEAVSTKKSQAAPPRGKTLQATPRGQQAPPRNGAASSGKTSAASRSSGKKASAPNDRAASRSGQRGAARLSNETLPPKSSVRTSPGQRDVSKRPSAEAAPSKPSKTVLPVLPAASSSSSSRRSSGRNQGVHELSACEQLTVELVRHEDSWPFMKLVSKTQVPDYYDIITKPIALSTIREKVNNCQYQTAGDFISDVELMFSNCLQYNPRQTNEAKAGVRLQQFFHSELSRLGLRERCYAPPTKRSRQ
ncbi:PREDICTED: bromodomain adjacent to zinc finger domain protein 1A [Cyprinodon variegatus]|uniref:bromodomain adjacent to zinc finger domain protein 1A n=1 Tax=Cyprinodon variegatus TaxID=28743 RepID=UPI0007429E73|nr:PREDICTED: bromodomain adjacent to zinc finger domain protein 1A [Cyprinodon variegatus]